MKRIMIVLVLCLAMASVAYGQLLDDVKSAAKDKATTVAKDTATKIVDDSAITAEVKANILAEESLKDSKIKVSTKNGVVSLKGTVKTKDARDVAASITAAVKGVKSVTNKITIEKPAKPVKKTKK
jgi:hyperosmotically inducible periplasmic protein